MNRHCLEPISLEYIGNDYQLTNTYGKILKERKVLFEKVKRGCRDTADFLKQRYGLKIWTWKELNTVNWKGERDGKEGNRRDKHNKRP
ncbi:MAG: hypothetical protein HY739_13065 [Desulfobacterales bacterium]|nr:hypothetical protein [Desulfobacterales bacterium]